VTEKSGQSENFEQIKEKAKARIEEERQTFSNEGPRSNNASPMTDFLLDCAKTGQIGDARAYISLMKGHHCYDHAAARWYQYQGHYWSEDAVSNVVAGVDQLIEVYEEEAKRWFWRRIKAKKQNDENAAKEAEKNEAIYLKKIAKLQDKTYRLNVLYLSAAGENSLGISGEGWDRNPYLIACPNGVIDLEKGEFRPGRPEDYIKTSCPTEWLGEDEPAPRWSRLLEEVFGGDSELIAYVKRLLGYGITGLVIHHILIILWGIGRNGKGTLLEILHFVLGPLVGPIQAELLLEQRNPRSSAGPSPDIMALQGKRIVWASETEEGRKLNTGKVKWLTGGDTLVGRVPYGKREVPFPPSHLLFLLTNFKPRVNAADFAMWQRIHLIPFKFSGDCIQFLIDYRKMGFRDACQYVGREVTSPTHSLSGRKATRSHWVPRKTTAPTDLWQERARRLVEESENWLFQPSTLGQKMLGWLKERRGLSEETIKKYRLGLIPINRWEGHEQWGLEPDLKEDGTPKKIWLPRGLTIPLCLDGNILRIRIRRPKMDLKSGDDRRYQTIRGADSRAMLLEPYRDIQVVVESDLDAILVVQEAQGLVGAVSLGTAGKTPDEEAVAVFRRSRLILVSLDSDDAGAKAAWRWWLNHFPQARRWPPVGGKDPGDMLLAGINLRTWIEAGIDEYGEGSGDLAHAQAMEAEPLPLPAQEKDTEPEREQAFQAPQDSASTCFGCFHFPRAIHLFFRISPHLHPKTRLAEI
jgi:putative DNA primase/helicase